MIAGYYRSITGFFVIASCNITPHITMQPALEYAFNVLGLHSVEAWINPVNIASRKLAEKNGFVQEAYYRENIFFDGRFQDSVVYSLLKG